MESDRPECHKGAEDNSTVGSCHNAITYPSFIDPQASIIGVVLGAVLIVTFARSLLRVSETNRRALAGGRLETGVLRFSLHTIFLQVTCGWAVMWAAYKLFSSDPNKCYWWYYHAVSTGIVLGTNLALEIALLCYLWIGDAGARALSKVASVAAFVGLSFGVTIGSLRGHYPGVDQETPSRESNICSLVECLACMTIYWGSLAYSYLRPGYFASEAALRFYSMWMGIFYSVKMLAFALLVARQDAGHCFSGVWMILYLCGYAFINYRTLVMDSDAMLERFTAPPAERHAHRMEQVNYMYQTAVVPPNQLYLLKEHVGEGTYGVASLHWCRGEEVVVKRLRAARVDAQALERLHNEALTLRALSHKNVVRFIGIYFDPPSLGIVMEHCPNGDLDVAIFDGQPRINQCPRHRGLIALDIAEGLAYLHNRGVVHRDVKTKNVLLAADWTAKLCDFGDAKRFRTSFSGVGISDSELRGTLAYMSPEALDGTDLTSASDMYSFGCVLFELLSGQHLYVIDDAASAREPIGVASDEKFDEAPLASLPSFHGEGAERSLQQALLDNEVPVEQKRIELRALRRKRLVSIIVNTGKRPPLPPHWPSKLQELLIMCWDRTPGRRPTAAIAVEFLRDNLRDLEELGNFAAVAAPRNVGAPEIASSQ